MIKKSKITIKHTKQGIAVRRVYGDAVRNSYEPIAWNKLVGGLLIVALIVMYGRTPVQAVAVSNLTVVKHVVNNFGGTKTAGDFNLHLRYIPTMPGALIVNQDFVGSETGVPFNFSLNGNYRVTEVAVPGYITSYDNCSSSITLGEDTKTCTVTNTAYAPSVNVLVNVTNSNGGTKTAGDFTFNVTATNPSSASFPGSSLGTLITMDAGAYDISTSDAGYDFTYSSGCSGNIAVGDINACTVEATDKASGGGEGEGSTGTLKVSKLVVGGTATSSDFSIHVKTVGEVSEDVVGSPQPGSVTGTSYTLTAGRYAVSESGPEGYATTFSESCAEGSTRVLVDSQTECVITNTWNLEISGEQLGEVGQTSATITWTTNHPATSRVVYDTVSHSVLGSDANYGYANSSVEDASLITTHSVVISGLTAGSTYFFRPVSHGSPEVTGVELSVSTISGGGSGGSGGGGSSGGSGIPSGGGVTPTLVTTGSPMVLGASTDVPAVATSNPVPQVLGASTTLPRTGMPVGYILLIFGIALVLADKKLKLV